MSDINVIGLCKSFEDNSVLENVNLCFKQGTKTAIMGTSGVGKTTLLRILMGLIDADDGEITGMPERFSCVFQEDRLCDDFTAITNLKISLPENTHYTDEDFEEHLSLVGLEGFMLVPVKTLSGGMKRRVAIARAVMSESDLIILDEPLKGLDEDTKDDVISYINKYTKDKTLIMVTHNENEAKDLNAKIIELKK